MTSQHQETEQGNGFTGVTVLIVATDPQHPGVHNCTKLLDKFGYDWKLLGAGAQWSGWRQRMAWYRDAARCYDDDRVLVCLDSYDAFPIRPLDDGLLRRFASCGTPLLFSQEAMCGGNCRALTDWWSSERGQRIRHGQLSGDLIRCNQYVNGGALMGTASAIAFLYDWMLACPLITDDQIGLGYFALQFPDLWTPDVNSQFFVNCIQDGTHVRPEETCAYFVHWPGNQPGYRGATYNALVKRFLGAEGRQVVASHKRFPTCHDWTPTKIVLLIAGILVGLVLIAAITGLIVVVVKTTADDQRRPRRQGDDVAGLRQRSEPVGVSHPENRPAVAQGAVETD